MSAVPPEARRAAWQVLITGGTMDAALDAAAPFIRADERRLIAEAAVAPGEDAPGRPSDGPGAAGQGAAGVVPGAKP